MRTPVCKFNWVKIARKYLKVYWMIKGVESGQNIQKFGFFVFTIQILLQVIYALPKS